MYSYVWVCQSYMTRVKSINQVRNSTTSTTSIYISISLLYRIYFQKFRQTIFCVGKQIFGTTNKSGTNKHFLPKDGTFLFQSMCFILYIYCVWGWVMCMVYMVADKPKQRKTASRILIQVLFFFLPTQTYHIY